MEAPEPAASFDDFLTRLEVVPWFTNLGCPTSDDARVERMAAWEDWPGPEESTVAEMSSGTKRERHKGRIVVRVESPEGGR